MLSLFQISRQPPSHSASQKPCAANCAERDECESKINQNETRDQQSIMGGSLINESQKRSSYSLGDQWDPSNGKNNWKAFVLLGKKIILLWMCLDLLTPRCQGISEAISFILVSVTEKSTQTTLMHFSFWANRGNKSREKRKGISVLKFSYQMMPAQKGQQDFWAVTLINLVADTLRGHLLIHGLLRKAFLGPQKGIMDLCLFFRPVPILRNYFMCNQAMWDDQELVYRVDWSS